MNRRRNIGIFIFDGAEVLDFAGPFEVFSVTDELNNHSIFDVFTVAENRNPITAINGLSVNPKYDFKTCPPIDILILAGGSGTRIAIQNSEILAWIKSRHEKAEYTLSICSGSRFLGILGLLDGKPYTTHHQVFEDMNDLVPNGFPKKNDRFVNSGNIYTSGGISAGIDLSFHLVGLLCGTEIVHKTATYMEYNLMDQ